MNVVIIKAKPNISKTKAIRLAREDKLTRIDTTAKLNDIICSFEFFELFLFLLVWLYKFEFNSISLEFQMSIILNISWWQTFLISYLIVCSIYDCLNVNFSLLVLRTAWIQNYGFLIEKVPQVIKWDKCENNFDHEN